MADSRSGVENIKDKPEESSYQKARTLSKTTRILRKDSGANLKVLLLTNIVKFSI